MATVTHNGHDFTALGSVIDHTSGHVIGYVSSDGLKLTTWEGAQIGTVRCTSSWRNPRSHFRSRIHAYVANIDGKRYYGRGAGNGMLLKLRKTKG